MDLWFDIRRRSLLVQVWLLTMISSVVADRRSECGARLTSSTGIIQTPNFPHAFPVPIRCKWIIEHGVTNGTISVFFTQQFTTSGLTFTEYLYYDDSYKLGERRALTVTEENITKVKVLQVQSPVLVVELSLDALEGSQLRALGLLAVFGLNVTYTVRAHASQPASCTALECRLLGHCYATHDYHDFFCSCFEGYSGADCGSGPLCARGGDVCKNGGTCRQMGPAAINCVCASGFTGDLCETHVSPPECEAVECSDGCRSRKKCDCQPKDNDFNTITFETKLQIMDQKSSNISVELWKQITSFLNASKIMMEDELEILNVSSPDGSGVRSVWLRVWTPRDYVEALRSTFVRLTATRTSVGIKFVPATLFYDVQPAVTLQSVTVNQRPEIWEGSEFILSCKAHGSPNIKFTWFKDGIKVNFNGTTRQMWAKTLTDEDTGLLTSVLHVSDAKDIDGGRWSCVAADAGKKRCKAIWITVLQPSGIRLMPSTLTVNKGDNISLTCLTVARRGHGTLGFSWARDRTLLRLAPGREVWEDLYPAGSVLTLYNVQKSGEFRCQVSSVAGTNSQGVTMWALGPNDEACDVDVAQGLEWPRTAPGAHASISCPRGYNGEIVRFCEPKTIQHGVKWKTPDFSGCVSEKLQTIYDEFIKLNHGYSWESMANITKRYEAALLLLPSNPGDGSTPLRHTADMLQYLVSAGKQADRSAAVEYLLKIYDTLLKHPDVFLDEEKIYELQNAVVKTAAMRDNADYNLQELSVMTKSVRDFSVASFTIKQKSTANQNWLIKSVGVELVGLSRNAIVVSALYNNLSSRLPSLRSSVEKKTAAQMEYLVASQHIQLFASGGEVSSSAAHTVTLFFSHVQNYSAIASKVACGLRSQSSPQRWSTKECEVRVPEHTNVACQCRGLGTFALFTVARSTLTHTEKDLRGVVKITVGVGGALCLAATALQMLGLLPSRKTRLPVLLKAATAGTHSAAMFTLLECDTRQEEACPGALGWVCAACWCAGCAALCAQPLLLQAELAGRAQKAPSVGLVAGVCTLAWLTARLWGGPPLQLGTAAQVVCAAGCTLLSLLCFALAICAGMSLNTITHKVPAERLKYFKGRRKVVRHTLALLLTTTAAQVASVAYAQPGERRTVHVIVLAVSAIVNGAAMFICYVVCDKDCLHNVRRAFSLNPPREWDESPAGDTSLSLYIKQGGEVESRGGVGIFETSSTHLSPMASFWRTPGMDSPDRMNRMQSTPDLRADIVQCVEYSSSSHSGSQCDVITSTPDVSLPAPARSCLKRTTSGSLPTVSVPPRLVQINREWDRAYQDHDKVLNKITNDLDFLLNRTEPSKLVLDEIEEAPT